MKIYEGIGVHGERITVQPILKRIDTTNLDSDYKEWGETPVGVIVEGRSAKLTQDNMFYHPITDKLYELVSSNV